MQGALDVLLAPESRARAAEEQEQLRERHGRRVPTHPALVTFFWAAGRAKALLDQIQSDEFTTGNRHLLRQLAEALAEQAQFTEAANLTPDEAQQKVYRTYAKAIANLGQRQCGCPEIRTYPDSRNAKGYRVPSLRDILKVSDGHSVFTLNKCLHCDAVSAY